MVRPSHLKGAHTGVTAFSWAQVGPCVRCGDTKRVFLYVFQGWKKGFGIRPMMDAVLSMPSRNQTKLGGRSLSVQLSLSHHLKHH
jgi:hypothetical protein